MTELAIASQFCAETIGLKRTLESGFIVLGERLAKIKKEELWRSQWDNFAAFLQEMDINEATASRLITVYTTYIEQYEMKQEELSGHSWYNLYQLRKVIPKDATPVDVKKLVLSAGNLQRRDIEQMIREEEHGECTHDWFVVHFRQCKHCGTREAVDN